MGKKISMQRPLGIGWGYKGPNIEDRMQGKA
jgi:hypothetical protein